MKHLGVVYNVGLRFSPEALSVPTWSPELARHDMACIAGDLGATAVRVEGEDLGRLEEASRLAHAHGLAVFFNPWLMHAPPGATRAYLEDAARVAERLRREGVDIVLVAGCELTIFSQGVYPGSGWQERGMWLAERLKGGEEGRAELAERARLLNAVLGDLAGAVRPLFEGQITYSAGLWEDVDWAPFDIIGLDFYRHGESAEEYLAKLDPHRAAGKKIVVTEVGSCKYEGAGELGDAGFAVLVGSESDGSARFADGKKPVRCEREQADYLAEQFTLLHESGVVDGAFAFEFSQPAMPAGEGGFDFDLASFALVKTFPEDDPRSREMPPWAPTLGYRRLGEVFARLRHQ